MRHQKAGNGSTGGGKAVGNGQRPGGRMTLDG